MNVYLKKHAKNVLIFLLIINSLSYGFFFYFKLTEYYTLIVLTIISLIIQIFAYFYYGIKIKNQFIIIKTPQNPKKYVIPIHNVYQFQTRSYAYSGKKINDFSIYYKDGNRDVVFNFTDDGYQLFELKALFYKLSKKYNKPLLSPKEEISNIK